MHMKFKALIKMLDYSFFFYSKMHAVNFVRGFDTNLIL